MLPDVDGLKSLSIIKGAASNSGWGELYRLHLNGSAFAFIEFYMNSDIAVSLHLMQHCVFSINLKASHTYYHRGKQNISGLVLKVSPLYSSILIYLLFTYVLKKEMHKPFWTKGSSSIFIQSIS